MRAMWVKVSPEWTVLALLLYTLRTGSVKDLVSDWKVACPDNCTCGIVASAYLQHKLKTVDCRWSNLNEVPMSIPQNTEVLNLRYNNITTLMNLPKLSKLQMLDISSNSLKDCSSKPIFGSYGSLLVLNLSNNNIGELHHGAFSGLKNLRILDLSSNEIHSVEHQDAFAGLNHLHKLFLNDNKLSSLDKSWLQGMAHLQELYLDRNNVTVVKSESINILRDLTGLSLHGNNLQSLHEDTFTGMDKLQFLDLADNNLTKIPTKALQQLPHLRDLILNKNPLPRLRSDELCNMNVENVSLSFMPKLILVEKSAFHNLTNLRVLHLHDNRKLFYVDPFAFSNVPHLQWLYLQNNHLTALPQQVEEILPQLTEIHLYNNRLYCDCNVHWIKQMTLESSSRNFSTDQSHISFPKVEEIMCDDPVNDTTVPLVEVPLESIPPICPPTTIPMFPDSNQLELGETLQLECHALGVPTPDMHWTLSNGKKLNITTEDKDARAILLDDSLLVLHNINAKDAGTYTCEARNAAGYDISSTAVKVHSSNIRVILLHLSNTRLTITWNGTDATVRSSDYKILYRQAGTSDSQKEIHLNQHMRKYTITNLKPETPYEFCIVYEHDSVYHTVNCLNFSTLHEAYHLQGITRISRTKVLVGVIVVFSSFIVMCVLALFVKRWRRKGYEKPDIHAGEIAETMSQIPLENLYQPPSTPLCTSRTSLLPGHPSNA